MSEFVECKEVVERLKDIISSDVGSFVYDYHVSDVLGIGYSTLRLQIAKDKLPLREIAKFCYERDLSLDEIIFNKKTTQSLLKA